MEREIKFRAWDNVDYMSTPFTLNDLQCRRIEFTQDAKIMQFTGLKDKNGVEIYEGDILFNDDGKEYGFVYYNEDRAMFMTKYPESDREFPFYQSIGNLYCHAGNVHEHPHLLNSENK